MDSIVLSNISVVVGLACYNYRVSVGWLRRFRRLKRKRMKGGYGGFSGFNNSHYYNGELEVVSKKRIASCFTQKKNHSGRG